MSRPSSTAVEDDVPLIRLDGIPPYRRPPLPLGVREIDGMLVRRVARLPEPGPRDHVAFVAMAAPI